MKKLILIIFACFVLSTCENPELIALLKAPSELASLEIVAYAGDTQLEGGAAMEPGFTTSVFDYTVFVSKDTDRFAVQAAINGNGSIVVMNEEDQETGTEFPFFPDEDSKVMIVTVQREYMETAEYHITVLRESAVPTAQGVDIRVTPGVAAFFLGSGVLPEFEVTAKLPAAGGELSYQWYMNTVDSNRGGSRINGATGKTYTMKRGETQVARDMYYYAEVINTLGGQTGTTETRPQRVTFLDKNELHEKSRAMDYMVNIPATPPGGITAGQSNWGFGAWSTPGFSMGAYVVTYELWKTVFDYAEAKDANYKFANSGNQGGDSVSDNKSSPIFVGNDLHPVSYINWRDAVVWCNAFSEMNNLEPVYVDSDGNVLRDSRPSIEVLIDNAKMTGNGYRLPTIQEWYYAARGANPSNPRWNNKYPGTNLDTEADQYVWATRFKNLTTEVGTLKDNGIGLYDMIGIVSQFIGFPDPSIISGSGVYACGTSIDPLFGTEYDPNPNRLYAAMQTYGFKPVENVHYFVGAFGYGESALLGLRLARNKEGE